MKDYYQSLHGKRISISFVDIGSNFYSEVTILAFVCTVTKRVSVQTTEIKLYVELENSKKYRIPEYLLIEGKGESLSQPKAFLPWVHTDNPNDAFVPCTITPL